MATRILTAFCAGTVALAIAAPAMAQYLVQPLLPPPVYLPQAPRPYVPPTQNFGPYRPPMQNFSFPQQQGIQPMLVYPGSGPMLGLSHP